MGGYINQYEHVLSLHSQKCGIVDSRPFKRHYSISKESIQSSVWPIIGQYDDPVARQIDR